MRIGPMELLILPVLVLGPTITIIMIWALIDAIRVPSDADYRAGTKIIWVLVILFLNCVGAVFYFAVGKPARR